MKTHFVTQGISSLNWENAHLGQLPNRVRMAMVDNDAYTGCIAKNPFNLKHFSSSQVAICLNEKMPVSLSKLDFPDNQYINGYRSLFATAWRIDMARVWILRVLTINLVVVFFDLTHLPLLVIVSLKNGKEMDFFFRS